MQSGRPRCPAEPGDDRPALCVHRIESRRGPARCSVPVVGLSVSRPPHRPTGTTLPKSPASGCSQRDFARYDNEARTIPCTREPTSEHYDAVVIDAGQAGPALTERLGGKGQKTAIIERHPIRHFTLPEIAFIADSVGFECLAFEEFLTGRTPSEDTWGVCVIMRKT